MHWLTVESHLLHRRNIAEREAKSRTRLEAELAGSVFNLTAEEWKNIVIAIEQSGHRYRQDRYIEQAEEIHAYIRSTVAEVYGGLLLTTLQSFMVALARQERSELFSKPDIDGGLIGGASLKAADFKGIIDALNKIILNRK